MNASRIVVGVFGPVALCLSVISCLGFADCTPALIPPVVPDAMTEAGCGTIDKINAARLIRAPDGSALWIPCDGGP